MDTEIKDLIESFVDKLYEIFELSTPIDIIKFVDTLNGRITVNPDIMEPDVQKTNTDSFELIVPKINKNKIARLIGILFLEMGFLCDKEKWEAQPWYLGYHTDAYQKVMKPDSSQYPYMQYFGHALLMPHKIYTKVLHQNSNDNTVYTNKIAEYFHVDVTSAWYRGYTLGLLEYM